jgi:hypothetical protein
LIQKFQIYAFRKGLNLFEFENAFDWNLSFEFKFKYAENKLQSVSIFSLAAQFNSSRVPLKANPYFLILFHFSSLLVCWPNPTFRPIIDPTPSPLAPHRLPPATTVG